MARVSLCPSPEGRAHAVRQRKKKRAPELAVAGTMSRRPTPWSHGTSRHSPESQPLGAPAIPGRTDHLHLGSTAQPTRITHEIARWGPLGPCSLDVLDVLLRHRLLRKPGGFEGLLGSRVEIRSSDQSLFDRVNEAVVHLDPRVAAMRLAALVKGDHYPVRSRVDDSHRLVDEVVIRLHPCGAELEELISAVKRALLSQEGLEPREGRNRVLPEQLGHLLRTDEAFIQLCKRVERRPRDLHVLLRHRLLPQPGGFEGVGVSCELADATDAPGAEVVERPDLGSLDLDAGRPPCSGVPNSANHLFSDRARVDFHPRIGPTVEITLYMAAKTLTAQVHTAIGKFGRVVVLEGRGEVGHCALRVTPVVSLVPPPQHLHVLLRHLLLPEPQGFERFRVIPEELLI